MLSKDEKKARATEAQRKWRAKNPNYSKEHYKNNRSQYAENNRRYYKKNSEQRKESARLWKEQNPDKERATQATYNAEHLEKKRSACRKWHAKNSESVSLRNKTYRAMHPEKGREKRARRHARKMNALPKWLNDEDILEIKRIYKEAQRTGLTVDHIVPLQGKNVCGLHVQWNLQLLTNIENIRKSNRFDG